MMGKLILGAAIIMVAALLFFLGRTLITDYGTARYDAGAAAGRAAMAPQIDAARFTAMQAAVAAQIRMTAAERTYGSSESQIAALLQKSKDEVQAYEKSPDAHAVCIDADRVRGIEAARDALFSGAASSSDLGSGSVSADAVRAGDGWKPK